MNMAISNHPALKPTVYVDSAVGLSLLLGAPAVLQTRRDQPSLAALLVLAVAAGGGLGFVRDRGTYVEVHASDGRPAG